MPGRLAGTFAEIVGRVHGGGRLARMAQRTSRGIPNGSRVWTLCCTGRAYGTGRCSRAGVRAIHEMTDPGARRDGESIGDYDPHRANGMRIGGIWLRLTVTLLPHAMLMARPGTEASTDTLGLSIERIAPGKMLTDPD